jgi:DNA-binding response OmpR family regulator
MTDQTSHTATVLIVDDNVWMQRVLAKMLLSFSVTPRVVSNAYDAVGVAVNDQPDAIILDVVMPEIDGLQTLRLLKAMKPTSSIPVLVITAAGDADSMGVALRLGADGFIRKPFTRASLLERLQSVLKNVEIHRTDGPVADVEEFIVDSEPTAPAPAARATSDTRFSPPPRMSDSPVRMNDSTLLRPGGRMSLPQPPPRRNSSSSAPPLRPWEKE